MRFKTVWTDAKVVNISDPAEGVRLFEIQPEGGIQPYNAGAHLAVSVLINGLPETRHYSLVGPYTSNGLYRVAVRRVEPSRGGSAYMWTLKPGSRLSISQPANQFQLTYGRDKYMLIAGGIGITPIYGMALDLAERDADFQLLYAGSSRNQIPFLDELQDKLGDRLRVFATDEGSRMNVTEEIAAFDEDVQLYICAPIGMLDEARHAWHTQARPAGDLRYETFAASGRFAARPFEVHLPRFGASVTVPANQTLLDSLNNAGFDVMSDCLRGECGLCVVDILECSGVVDHRDMFFSEEQKAENRKMCACVSRVVNGNVVIDTAYRGKLSQI